MERVRFISHQNQRVLLLDLTAASLADITMVIEESSSIIQRASLHSLLTLTDVTNIVVRDVSTRQLMDFMRGNKPFVKAAAVVGVAGIARSILATTNLVTGRSLKAFETRGQALDWLVSL